MSNLKDNIEANQDELNNLLIDTGNKADEIYEQIENSTSGKKKLSESDEDELQEQLVQMGNNADKIDENLQQLGKILEIFDVINKHKDKPESTEYKDAKKNAEKMKEEIMKEYKESLTNLEKEFSDLIKNGTKISTLYGATSKTTCGTKTCRQILENITKDFDFKELAKNEPFANLQKMLTNKNDLNIQAGGSKHKKTHRSK